MFLKRFPSLLCEEYIGETKSQLIESKEANAIVLVRMKVTGISGRQQQQQEEESLLFSVVLGDGNDWTWKQFGVWGRSLKEEEKQGWHLGFWLEKLSKMWCPLHKWKRLEAWIWGERAREHLDMLNLRIKWRGQWSGRKCVCGSQRRVWSGHIKYGIASYQKLWKRLRV